MTRIYNHKEIKNKLTLIFGRAALKNSRLMKGPGKNTFKLIFRNPANNKIIFNYYFYLRKNKAGEIIKVKKI